MRSIFYTPAQPQRSSCLEGRRHTRQESRGESVSLRSARLSGGDLHSVRATSAGHIETDAHEPIGLSAARLRSQFFFFFCRLFVSEFISEGIFSRDEAAAASGGNLAENVITGQAAVIASMPFQLEGRSFSWTGGRIHFWLPQGGMLHC